jgi:hypothetical protein
MKKYMKKFRNIFGILSFLQDLGESGVVTFDGTSGASSSAQGPISSVGRLFQLRARVTIPLTGVTNDIVKAIPVKLGTRVLHTAMRLVQKSNGSAMTLKLGDGDATGAYQNTTMDAVGGAVGLTQGLLPADTNGVTPKIYAADDTIDILLAGVTAQSTIPAIVDVLAVCEDLTADPGDWTTGVVAGSS